MTVNYKELKLTLAFFHQDEFEIRVVDNVGRKFDRLASAMSRLGAVAGVTGGPFDEATFNPAGLMIADGNRIGILSKRTRLDGLLLVENGKPALIARNKLQLHAGIQHLLQSGPWLIYDDQREASKSHVRTKHTFISTDGNGNWAIGVSDPCSLADLAAALQRPTMLVLIRSKFAIALGDGATSGFWCQTQERVTSIPEETTVRNFISVFQR